ncbi:MAG: PadR family transcriptional regulator [Oscillospiraceae bacterium]
MNTQFKKGVLDLIVLLVISEEDKYGYQLVSEVSKIVDVNEGTIYPLLKRLTNENYCETYLEQSAEGPARKYYKTTRAGKVYLNILVDEWMEFSQTIDKFIKERHNNDQK